MPEITLDYIFKRTFFQKECRANEARKRVHCGNWSAIYRTQETSEFSRRFQPKIRFWDKLFDVSSFLLLTQDNLLTDGFRLSISHTLCLLSKRVYTVIGSSLNTRFDWRFLKEHHLRWNEICTKFILYLIICLTDFESQYPFIYSHSPL